jgi:hypothetical protein
MPRRVGSASAWKVESSRLSTMWFNMLPDIIIVNRMV